MKISCLPLFMLPLFAGAVCRCDFNRDTAFRNESQEYLFGRIKPEHKTGMHYDLLEFHFKNAHNLNDVKGVVIKKDNVRTLSYKLTLAGSMYTMLVSSIESKTSPEPVIPKCTLTFLAEGYKTKTVI